MLRRRGPTYAILVQLIERLLAMQKVAGLSPASRSNTVISPSAFHIVHGVKKGECGRGLTGSTTPRSKIHRTNNLKIFWTKVVSSI